MKGKDAAEALERGGEKGGHWMKKAFANAHGQLRGKLGAKKGKPIAAGKLQAAAEKGGKLGKQARLAEVARRY